MRSTWYPVVVWIAVMGDNWGSGDPERIEFFMEFDRMPIFYVRNQQHNCPFDESVEPTKNICQSFNRMEKDKWRLATLLHAEIKMNTVDHSVDLVENQFSSHYRIRPQWSNKGKKAKPERDGKVI